MAERATDGAMLALGGKPVTRDRQADAKADISGGMKAAFAMLGVTDEEIQAVWGVLPRQEIRAMKAVLEWRRAAIVKKAEEL